MGKVLDLQHRRFGKLIVVDRLPSRRNSAGNLESMWKVQCDCGTVKGLPADGLRSGKTQSCGCLRRERRTLPNGAACRNRLFGWYKRHAKARQLSWHLSLTVFEALTQQSCAYCGQEPLSKVPSLYGTGDFIYNGLDRVNNEQGYTVENVVSCCELCNRMKMVLSREQFLTHVERIHQYQTKAHAAAVLKNLGND